MLTTKHAWLWLILASGGFVGACGEDGEGDAGIPLETKVDQDPEFSKALTQVEPHRAKLKDRNVHPERFARWLVTVPPEYRALQIRIASGQQSVLIGARPGTREAELLAAAPMTQEEGEAWREEKRKSNPR
jgi:hypothetical protein